MKGFHRKIGKARNVGINMVELSIDYPWPYDKKELLSEVLEGIVGSDLGLAIHAPWRDIPFSTPYPYLGDALIRIINDAYVNIREYVKPLYIVIHPQTLQRMELFDNRKHAVMRTRERLEKLIDITNGETPILLENITRGFASEISNLIEIIDGIDNTGICLDVGHLASRYNRELTQHYDSFYDYLEDVVKSLSDVKVYAIHLHDVDRNNKEHLLIGEGQLQFKRIYKIVSKIKPRHVVYEVFNSKKSKITIDTLIRNIEEQVSWGRIYLH